MINLKKNYLSWHAAEKIIPGGNGLLSKRPQRFLPGYWPTYYRKAKGVMIQDLKKKWFIDMSIMGVGANILGYANKFVDKNVKKAIDTSVTSTLNCKEEFLLAKELLRIDKFANKVKFSRSGGEAMAMAVRLARAYKKKDLIAFSGYHGWHDWYLATNLKSNQNLKDHLLPGLNPLGVPKSLTDTIIPFKYNSIKEIKEISKKNLAAIVVEGCRFQYPTKEFVKTINEICKKKNICLIVDEITSGWRETVGGIYKKVGFKPDMIVYGKGIGNGYAISMVVGKNKYMEMANETFMSSTSWTEKVGFVAAISTIKYFKKNKVHLKIKQQGLLLSKIWSEIAKIANLDISINEFHPLCSFTLNYGKKNNYLYTLFTQEMLKRGYIASNTVYLSSEHKKKILLKYKKHCLEVFKIMKKSLNSKKNLLLGKIKSVDFKRLT